MSIAKHPLILFGTKPAPPLSSYLLDGISNIAFAFSKYKLLATATNSIRASNVGLTEADISFVGDVWDEAAIETNAGGGLATVASFIDQSGVYGNLTNATKSLQPHVTDASGNALGFIDNNSGAGMSLINENTANLPALTDDYVCAFVMANDTGTSATRSTFSIRKSGTSNINVVVSLSGSTYLIEYIEDSALPLVLATYSYTYTPSDITDFFLITLTRIGGTVTLYVNGTSVTWGSGTLTFNLSTLLGVNIARRHSTAAQSRVFDYQTLLLFTGADLSGFDISAFNTATKLLHGIS